MTTEQHISRIGKGLPHKCYHWRYVAEHKYPMLLKWFVLSGALNICLIFILMGGIA